MPTKAGRYIIVCSKSPEDHAADAERGSTDEATEAPVGRIDELARIDARRWRPAPWYAPLPMASSN
jgi:hypothetical protein